MISLHNLPLPFQKLRPALRAEQAVRHQAILFLPRAHPAVGRGTEQAVGSEATNAALHFLYRFPAIALAQHQAMRRDRQWRDDRRARGVGRLPLDVDELAKVVHVERRVDLPAARRPIFAAIGRAPSELPSLLRTS